MSDDVEQPPGESVSYLGKRIGIIQVSGKIRGRRARRLGDQLEDLAQAGVERLVLDLRDLGSIDSLGSLSLERGIDADRCLNLRGLARRTVKIHRDFEVAIATVRGIVESGLQLV
jgi:hypothetical protein